MNKPLTFLLALTFLFLFSVFALGQKTVKKKYYDNRNLKRETHFKNRKRDGPEIRWYPSGIKFIETHYKDGKKEGLWTYWYADGTKEREESYKNGNR
tara:strand:- start:692 stop:982 length:291 start_codon:yes stop_codon:yes gene_type:complete